MSALYRNRALAEAMSDKLRVFAQPQRLMILSCLLEGEKSVSEIDAMTGIGQPALSQQLAELRRAELVRARRAAKQVHYTLAGEDTALCVRTMEAMLGDGQAGTALPEPMPSPASPAPPSPAPSARAPGKPVPPGAAGFARIG